MGNLTNGKKYSKNMIKTVIYFKVNINKSKNINNIRYAIYDYKI